MMDTVIIELFKVQFISMEDCLKNVIFKKLQLNK